MTVPATDTGLENVVAAATVLSEVDGEGGRLIIHGEPIESLARRARYEDAAHLLWSPFFTDLPDADALRRAFGAARARTFRDLFDDGSDVVRALRLGWARLADGESLEHAIALAGAAPVLTAAAVRRAHNLPPIAPDPGHAPAADFLRMLGVDYSTERAEALTAYLVTVCDHGLNASTFTARVVASTRAGLVSAVVAGLCALKGPLHGGAPGPVLDMLDSISAPEDAESWIEAALARGERLMGFGHRVYRRRDPRADALKAALRHLPSTAGRLAFAEAIERQALQRLAARHPARALETNVEYYTALLLEALGAPRSSFTAIFAMGRVLGWIAHAKEQIAEGRLVRPRSVYCGPRPAAAA